MKLFGSMQTKDNELLIGGVKTTSLAKEYGTPLYVMDEELIRNNCRDYYKSFKCEENGNRVTYAGKAFINLWMCNLIKEEGLCLDVVSGGELYTAYKAEFPMERILFHGNNKTIDEIELGVRFGVGTFVVDNMYEIYHLNEIAKRYGKVQKIYMRLTPGVEAHTHDYIKTGQIDSKFGFSPLGTNMIDSVKEVLSMDNVELYGVHCHIGSQIFEIEPFEDATEIMLNFIKEIKDETGHVIKDMDLGGGFGIYYVDGDKPKETSEYCNAILKRAEEVCNNLNIEKPRLLIEPGRSIIGNAGTTLYKAGSIKEIPGLRKYVSVDGGMTDNIRPALYGADYECIVTNNVIHDITEEVTVCGKCCESGDILLNNIRLPKINSGDIIAIPTTGAYCYSMASNYNKIPRGAVISVKDGVSKLVCRRESYEDIIKNEVI